SPAYPSFHSAWGTTGTTSHGRSESHDAKTVTRCPRSWRPMASEATMRSVPAYVVGGSGTTGGAMMAIRSASWPARVSELGVGRMRDGGWVLGRWAPGG